MMLSRDRTSPDLPVRAIALPFLRQSVPAGDAVARITAALGIRQCSSCEQRRRSLNRQFVLKPWGSK